MAFINTLNFFVKGTKMKAKSGFTLVEILIVVVILGILAAIVIPQFTQASTEAKQNSLMSDLQTFRSQIELYKVQHTDDLPTDGGLTFVAAMTGQTELSGLVSDGDPTNGVYGPYLQQIPKNPFNDMATVREDGAPAGANTEGWRFDTTTGAIQADDTGTCADGTAHTAL
jgi:general secretion pathway protein G